ncbi:MAG: alpha/beta fold hydrolase [Verrucomicrobia bacterium]|nr:alpha/beta fold hydrolase [Verrucomicrobiota bacterium]
MIARELTVPLADAALGGELNLPHGTTGLVIFAHGSGSSRHSSRNQSVARTLRQRGLGTLLFDLLTAEEERAELPTRHLRFNITFLADRLVAVTQWARQQPGCGDLNVGYFGASTGAAAALVAAANLPDLVRAVVSRGGRPDLAEATLDQVKAPTLLIVGGADTPVIPLNQHACSRLHCEKSLRIIPHASHLFEEPGALEKVAEMAADWFVTHLATSTGTLSKIQ